MRKIVPNLQPPPPPNPKKGEEIVTKIRQLLSMFIEIKFSFVFFNVNALQWPEIELLFCFCVVETGGDGDQRNRKGDSGRAEQTGEGEEEGGGRHRTGREEIFRGGRRFRRGGEADAPSSGIRPPADPKGPPFVLFWDVYF